MIALIIGGSGSGKSQYAEDLAVRISDGELCYIATMKVWGDEGLNKVKRHKELRQGKGFETIEQPQDLQLIKNRVKNKTVLIECLSNLTANEMFKENEFVPKEYVSKKIISDIYEIFESSKNTVIVTNNIFEEVSEYDMATKEYIETLGEINQKISSIADVVTEIVYSIPVEIKGNTFSGGLK